MSRPHMFFKTIMLTCVVFAASLAWLFMTRAHCNRTHEWVNIKASVLKNDVHKSSDGNIEGWATTVQYRVDDVQYEAVVDEYLVGNTVDVFVDPKDPTSVVGIQGAPIQKMLPPIIVTVGSGLFGIVLLLVAMSPKDD